MPTEEELRAEVLAALLESTSAATAAYNLYLAEELTGPDKVAIAHLGDAISNVIWSCDIIELYFYTSEAGQDGAIFLAWLRAANAQKSQYVDGE